MHNGKSGRLPGLSGVTWPTTKPVAAPENRPVGIQRHLVTKPWAHDAEVGLSISRMPGAPPLGPS